jgi:hypothetical protein
LLIVPFSRNMATDQETVVTTIVSTSSSTATQVNHIQQTVSSIESVMNDDITSILQATADVRQRFESLQDAVVRVVPETEQIFKRFVETYKRNENTIEGDTQLVCVSGSAAIESLSSQPDRVTAISTPSRCLCRKWNRKRVKDVNSGPVRIFRETLSSASHHESCPYYTDTARTVRIGFGTRILNPLLSRLMEGTFTATFGAGGVSIYPSLNLRSVYRPNSPAFKLLDDLGNDKYPTDTMKMSPDVLRAEFRRLFQNHEASPFDVDEEGRTLIHVGVP